MVLVLYALLFLSICCGINAVQVTVKQGILEGARVPLVTEDGYFYSFKGIPYAQPPLGHLRFRHPLPPLNWTGVRDAKAHGNICLQGAQTSDPTATIGDEDCLFLNVYTPSLNDSALPVMVYIHGGGFVYLSGDDDKFGPDFLLPHNVVLVTLNYRLGPLGFLSLDTEEVPGNAGFKDQVAAMRWVQENIAQFGGNPNNVTLFGQSAGSVSVSLHMVSPMSKGLFHRAIAISGTFTQEWTLPFEPVRQAFAIGRLLGLDTTNKNDLFTFLQQVNGTRLANLQPNVLVNQEKTNFLKTSYFTYSVEKFYNKNSFLNEDPLEILSGGGAHQADIIFMQTDSEFLAFYTDEAIPRYNQYTELFTPRGILDHVPPKTALSVGDSIKSYYFGNKTLTYETRHLFLQHMNDGGSYEVNKYIEHLDISSNNSIYFLQLSAVTSRNVNREIYAQKFDPGAGHSDDWYYMFHPKEVNLTMSNDSLEYGLVKKLTTLITNFAKYGNPTPSWKNDNVLRSLSWPKYNSSTKHYLNFGTSAMTIGKELRAEAYAVYDNLYQSVGICF